MVRALSRWFYTKVQMTLYRCCNNKRFYFETIITCGMTQGGGKGGRGNKVLPWVPKQTEFYSLFVQRSIIIFITPYLQRPPLVGHPQGTFKWPPFINCLNWRWAAQQSGSTTHCPHFSSGIIERAWKSPTREKATRGATRFSGALVFRSLYYPWGKMGTTRSLQSGSSK